MTSEALLPCPFCGGAVAGDVVEGSSFRWRRVSGCCTDGPEIRHNTLAQDQAEAEAESRTRAIAAWNTRQTVVSNNTHSPTPSSD